MLDPPPLGGGWDGRVHISRVAVTATTNFCRCWPPPADFLGATPLHTAAFHGHADAVEALLDAHADVSATNAHGSTPMAMATSTFKDKDVIALLRVAEARAAAAEELKAAVSFEPDAALPVARYTPQARRRRRRSISLGPLTTLADPPLDRRVASVRMNLKTTLRAARAQSPSHDRPRATALVARRSC